MGATLLYIIEQIDRYLRVSNSMSIRVKAGLGLETLAAHDLGETFEHRFLEDVTEEQLSYGLPSEQVHPIGYLMFVMLAEIRSDLFDQYDALIEKFEEYKLRTCGTTCALRRCRLRGTSTATRRASRLHDLQRRRPEQEGARRSRAPGAYIKDGANRPRRRAQMRDDTAEHSCCSRRYKTWRCRKSCCGRARRETRRRRGDRGGATSIVWPLAMQPVDMGFEDPQALAFLLTQSHSRYGAGHSPRGIEAAGDCAASELAAVDPKDEQLYMKKRPGALVGEVDL